MKIRCVWYQLDVLTACSINFITWLWCLEVQLTGTAFKKLDQPFCFCTPRHLYTGAIRRKQETAKHSALQHATLTANQHYSTATQLRLVHKNTQEKRLESQAGKRVYKIQQSFIHI